MKKSLGLIIVGAGGQGVLLAGDIIAKAFVFAGFDVKVSALRGIAQRGGTVVVHLRAGKKVHSPLIPRGKTDMLLALDLPEALRRIDYLRKDGQLFFLSWRRGGGVADDAVMEKESHGKIFPVEYDEIAKQIKDIRTANVFMIGILAHHLALRKSFWLRAIEATLPSRMRKRNLDSFSAGLRYPCEREQRREAFV